MVSVAHDKNFEIVCVFRMSDLAKRLLRNYEEASRSFVDVFK